MTTSNTISTASVVLAARGMAKRYRLIAIFPLAVLALLVLVTVAGLATAKRPHDVPAAITGLAILAIAPGAPALWLLIKGRNRARIARAAAADPALIWYLVGDTLAPTEPGGAPRVDLAFFVGRQLRGKLAANLDRVFG